MNIPLEELLKEIEKARRIFLAVYGSDGLVVAYVRVAKRELRQAFQSPERVSWRAVGCTHNQRTAEYYVQWNGEDLFIR